MLLLQLLSFKSQNCEVYFSNVFTLEMRLSTSPVFVIIYFEILCSNSDMAKKPITWMTIIRVAESTLWWHRKPYVSYLEQTRVEISNVLITGEFCNPWITGEFCNPWSTLFLHLSMHQCCIISTFESSIFTYYCNRLHGYGLQICGIIAFLKCVSFRTRLNSHY